MVTSRPGVLALLAAAAWSTPAAASPNKPAPAPGHDGAHARVTFGNAGVLRPAREAVGRREEPLTDEEATAKQIENLLRGPLRSGVTGLFVADAKTGQPLFAVNADDALNPASNVKMISTATALELLGPDFRYPTRVLGPEPDAQGAVHGNIYLLGSWDPTLATTDFDDLAGKLAARGIKQLDGDVMIGSDATRDGIYRAIVPIEIKGAAPGQPPIATAPAGFDLITFQTTAKTTAAGARPRLSYAAQSIHDATGHLRVQLAISGSIGKGRETMYPLLVTERAAAAAHALRAALRAHQITVNGDVATKELGDFITDATLAGALPVELARHESARLTEIVAHVNKWSINWLADRVIMTAAALAKHQAPSMELALDAMYGWLSRHTHTEKADAILDTGSGLSYKTRITPRELVAVVRSAAGYATDADPFLGHAWIDSLSIAGTDGTLSRRFRDGDVRGRLHGKTGTLSTVIALSGVLDIDPARPLAFSIVTNGDRPLSKAYVRKAHEQVVSLICKYLAKTAKVVAAPAATTPPTPALVPATAPAAPPHGAVPDDLEEAEPDPQLDAETAGQASK
jgi:D-alanyl-D-alanine carboxypeptidase/D-alanyl-D-alanine-endopeptidase (penicillin-binding protein 4)